MNSLILCLLFSIFILSVRSDIPTHCLYEDYYGQWTYSLSTSDGDNTINCSQPFDIVGTLNIDLKYPNVVLDESGNSGFWTRIYDEGVEVVLNGRKFFAFSYYDSEGYDCSKTSPGWFHNEDGTEWGCYVATKVESSKGSFNHLPLLKPPTKRNLIIPPPEHFHPVLTEVKRPISFSDLPNSWDWRNVSGVNYVSPIRDQGHCGSCYAFASMGMFEARIRVVSNNKQQPVLSTQNIVSCSQYSQGCDGGFPYLISKYGQDFQFYEDSCFPYTASDSDCTPCDLSKSKLYRSTGYHYVGGYYGACSPEEMRMEIYVNGPVAVSFEVYDDLYSYTSGVYVHNSTTKGKRTNPWEITNHVVVIVGWGVEDSTGVPYWIVKNSWGTSFGQDGYFWIRRNTDECGIESMAVAATPILPN